MGKILLGMGCVSYKTQRPHCKSLINLHHMRNNGIEVNDMAASNRGTQNIIIQRDGRSSSILLDSDGDIMIMQL